jgi:TPR repeat protein
MPACCRFHIAVVLLSMIFGCAAASPIPDTAYNLGVRAFQVKDYALARQHWSQAAEENETSAFNNLGFLLYNGMGGEADPVRAVALWAKAAALGHSEAQWHLAKAFEDGKGTSASMTDAYAWYRCASANFPAVAQDEAESEIAQDARQSLLRLLARLPLEQLVASEQLARDYVAKYASKPAVQR